MVDTLSAELQTLYVVSSGGGWYDYARTTEQIPAMFIEENMSQLQAVAVVCYGKKDIQGHGGQIPLLKHACHQMSE